MGNTGSIISAGIPPVDLQYEKSKISIWWDMENCDVPITSDPHCISQNISSALVKMKYCGPVSISVYGDTNRLSASVHQALKITGIVLNHVSAGVKGASYKKMLMDMLFWAVDNPAPANYLLISGDQDFSNALHQLRMRRYNVLLAQSTNASAPLVAAATSVWLWTTLCTGGPPLTKDEASKLVLHIETDTPKVSPLDTKQKGKQSWINNTNDLPEPEPVHNYFKHRSPKSNMYRNDPDKWDTWESPKEWKYIKGQIDVILFALEALKTEKIMPTEANLADCIRYGNAINRNTDVKKAIEIALERQFVVTVKQSLGALKLYVGKNDKLWDFVNIWGRMQYPIPTWEEVKRFMLSSDGRSAIMASESKYEAAIIIKETCLKELYLGEILHIVHLMVRAKKWIAHNPSGWQPIRIQIEDRHVYYL